MARRERDSLIWLLLLGLGVFFIGRQTVRFLDPETGQAVDVPTATPAIRRHALSLGMTYEAYMERATREAAAAGMPLWRYLEETVPGMP